ncbi:hypothetical protein FRB99_004893 [Tulasnella sp. 403]|nr:hypothetical protein FRB99_004893 [Tulasnella sp. 403]
MLASAQPIRVKNLAMILNTLGDSSLATERNVLHELWIRLVFSPFIASLRANNGVINVISPLTSSRPELSGLKSLVLDNSHRDSGGRSVVANLLRHCEELEELDLKLGRDDSGAPIGIEATSLPRLRAYRGDYRCAEEFIAGRPVDQIHIYPTPGKYKEQPDMLRVLSSTTVPVRHIQIEQSLIENIMPALAKTLPYLETLEIRAAWLTRAGMAQIWKEDGATQSILQMRHLQRFTYFSAFSFLRRDVGSW